MGDSISAGYGIQREEGWVELLSFLEDLDPNDPNPLTYKETALFAVDSPEVALQRLDAAVVQRVHAIAPGAVIQLYRRLGVRELLS